MYLLWLVIEYGFHKCDNVDHNNNLIWQLWQDPFLIVKRSSPPAYILSLCVIGTVKASGFLCTWLLCAYSLMCYGVTALAWQYTCTIIIICTDVNCLWFGQHTNYNREHLHRTVSFIIASCSRACAIYYANQQRAFRPSETTFMKSSVDRWM